MKFDRFTGKTREEALQAAASAKQTTVEKLTWNVVEEKSGFLGIGKTVEIEAFCDQDIAQFIHDYIQSYFDNAQMDGVTEVVQEAEDFYKVRVNTNSNAILIGKGGKTLQEFNKLVKAAASAVFRKRVRLLIDVNGYKEERYERIIRMAKRVAHDVRRTHVDAVLEPMTADERKAIHNALADMEGITTRSQGEGASRQMHILYTPGKSQDQTE